MINNKNHTSPSFLQQLHTDTLVVSYRYYVQNLIKILIIIKLSTDNPM